MMPQIVECPKCAKKLNAPDKLAGMRVACPACQAPVSIPPIQAPKQPSAPARVAGVGTPAAANPAAAQTAAVIQCPHCTKKFKGSAQLQGKNIRCPACSKDFTARLQSVAAPPIKSAPVARPPIAPAIARPQGLPARPLASPLVANTQAKAVAPKKPAVPTPARSLSFSGGRPRMLYLVFALAFLPLIFQTLSNKAELEERLTHTFAAHPDIESKLDSLKSTSDFFALLPDGRIEGAHLSYYTRVHWAYAAIAAAGFFVVCWLLFDPGKATIAQWFIVLGVTGTVGIVSLLAFQWIADVTQGVWLTGGSVLVLLFYIVKFIGFSYSAAADPHTNFWLSFFGFTFGVGLCEEVTKALPVIVWLGEDKKLDWRAACILGLASGVGFGVVEGIMYSGEHYNGLMSADIYLTRFISCVALHATWTAAVCLMAVRNLSGFNTSEATDWTLHLLLIISVPAIMHGLYDTLLKKGFDGYALAVALASFAWLAFMLERARSSDEEYTPRRVARAAA
jgi:RsiW-degrading membrane proteinase PrsW (M82 family)